jgi:hypothetical protein
MTNEIKELLDAAILNDENCVYFDPDSRGTYTIIFGNSSVYDVYVITGQELLDAINANKENYAFDVASTPYVLYTSNENPYITLFNIKEK